MSRRLAWAALLCLAAGCSIEPYHLSSASTNDGGTTGGVDARPGGGDGAVGIDARPPTADDATADGLIPGCTPVPETCNNQDDDCDTVVDDGFDKQNDPRHCGGCNQPCNQLNSSGTCAAGQCSFTCLPGFHDLDDEPGCEYSCIPTAGGNEACDGLDNDCDDKIDEDFDLTDDVRNCGGCNHVCVALHATAVCVEGECDYDREFGCEAPYTDITDAILGCEYLCQVSPPEATESCDNIDNDCDGMVDEGAPGGGATCGSDVGECEVGVTACVAGHVICTDQKLPTAEICDGKDNNCNDEIDEGYDRVGDPRHCGPTCQLCQITNAIAKCIPGDAGTGECAIAVCLPGFVDRDGEVSTGCELACTVTGSEVCDGLDNDCDGMTDEELVPPTGLCVTSGACTGTVAVCGKGPIGCDQTTAWRCAYPAAAEKDLCGNLRPQETLCDDLDGDCDGHPDDNFANKGQLCGDDAIGICRSTGTFECKDDGTGTECVITTPGQTPAASDALCDGRDEDCDGDVDEEAVDDTIVVGSFRIDVYEASRPDATSSTAGVLEHRPCSEPNRLPWTNVTHERAETLCAAAGKRLCTEAEWQQACSAGTKFPYGNAYDDDACNGADRLAGPDDHVVPTGSLAACTGSRGTFDMSGNLKEWTSQALADGLFRIRGGAFDNVAPGLTCDFDFVAADGETYQFDNLGFRCCDAP